MTAWLARQKMYFGYSSSWITTPTIGYLAACQLQKQLVDYWNVAVPIKWLVVGAILGIWFGGWVMVRMGLFSAESNAACRLNPMLQEMLNQSKEHRLGDGHKGKGG